METVIRKIEMSDLLESVATIRKSFGTVASDFDLTRDNCPTNCAFTQIEHLEQGFLNGDLMYGLYERGAQIGFFELQRKSPEQFELRKLSVRPKRRHEGLGAHLLAFACNLARELGGKRITIGIIEENTILKNWYLTYGFIHTGTKNIPNLPFTVGFMEMIL